MECKICGKKSEDDLCSFHRASYENLLEKFEEWRKMMDISWVEYLKALQKIPYTGKWIKEVIQYLLSNSEDVKRI